MESETKRNCKRTVVFHYKLYRNDFTFKTISFMTMTKFFKNTLHTLLGKPGLGWL